MTRDFCDRADSLQRESFQNDPQRFAALDFLVKGICGLIKQMSRAVPNLVLTFPFQNLNSSRSTTREVIKSQHSIIGGEGWADTHRSLAGNSSQPVLQPINTTVTHHNFYSTLATGYVFSMREIYFSKYQLSLLKIPFWYFGCHLWRDCPLPKVCCKRLSKVICLVKQPQPAYYFCTAGKQ